MQICLNCLNQYNDNNEKGICPHCGFGNWKYKPNDFCLELGVILKEQYKVGTVIGAGGFGITYRAVDLNTGHPVAIKEYYPNGMVSRNSDHRTVQLSAIGKEIAYAKGLNGFLEEARGLAKFHGIDNIVQVYDFFEQNGTAYIVMEYLRGKSLSKYTKDMGGMLDVNTATNFLMDTINALEIVHSTGMVHRDISPDNLFVQNNGTIKLIDFGAARESYGYEDKTLSIVLKPNFAPPEQFQKKSRQGPWTDIYALGATIYKVLTGKMPPESIGRYMEDDLIPPSHLNSTVPKYYDNIMLKMMALKIEDRFQNANELRKEILKHVDVNVAGKQPTPPLSNYGNTNYDTPSSHRTTSGYQTENRYKTENSYQTSLGYQTENHSIQQSSASNAVKKKSKDGILPVVMIGVATVIIVVIIVIVVQVSNRNSGGTPPSTEQVVEIDSTSEEIPSTDEPLSTDEPFMTEEMSGTELPTITEDGTTEENRELTYLYGRYMYESGPIFIASPELFGYSVEDAASSAKCLYYYFEETGNNITYINKAPYEYLILVEIDGKIEAMSIYGDGYTDEDLSAALVELKRLYGEPELEDVEDGDYYYRWFVDGPMYVILHADGESIYLYHTTEQYYLDATADDGETTETE